MSKEKLKKIFKNKKNTYHWCNWFDWHVYFKGVNKI